MAKKNKGSDNRQLPLNLDMHFYINSEPVRANVEGGSNEVLSDFEMRLRMSIKDVLDKCSKREIDPLDRIDVAARMTRILGRDITKTHIDQWTALSAITRRIHADSLKALCEVTNDYTPLHVFVESCGFKALHPEEAKAAEYGSKMLLKRIIDIDIKEILVGLDEDELKQQLLKRIMGGSHD